MEIELNSIIQQVFKKRRIYEKYGYPRSTWQKFKIRFKQGTLEHETKQAIAQKAGFRLKSTEVWIYTAQPKG